MILVVGATGEVGFAVVQSLRTRGREVTALIRPTTDASAVEALGVRVIRGDLNDPDSLGGACTGADVVVATANAIVPRRREKADFDAMAVGYGVLARSAREAGVRRFVYVSVPREFMNRGAHEFDVKARIEQQLAADGPPLSIVRSSLFMECWLPAVGSRLAVSESDHATLNRGFWLTRLVAATTQRSIDRFSVALVPGSGSARHAFITVGDVAEAIAAIASDPDRAPSEVKLGGPAVLSWHEVVEIYSQVLGRRLRKVHQPVTPFRALSTLLGRRSPAAGHLLAAQALASTQDSSYSSADTAALLGREPVNVKTFLDSKLTASGSRQ